MKNKIWATFAFAAIFCSASCAEDDTFAFNPDYNTQDGYTPDGIASWPQAIFCFDDNRCTEVEMAPSQAALRGIETSGNRATALAFASQDNLSFTNTSTGGALDRVYPACGGYRRRNPCDLDAMRDAAADKQGFYAQTAYLVREGGTGKCPRYAAIRRTHPSAYDRCALHRFGKDRTFR